MPQNAILSSTTLSLGLLFYTLEPEERQYVPSSPQKGTGVFAKGLSPVRRVSHRGRVRLHLKKCGLSDMKCLKMQFCLKPLCL